MHAPIGFSSIKTYFPYYLWHARLGHAYIETTRKLESDRAVDGLFLNRMNAHSKKDLCKSCISRKLVMRITKFNSVRETAVEDGIYSDVLDQCRFPRSVEAYTF